MLPLLNQKKPEFEKVIGHYKSELATIRGGRAHAALLDKIMVEAYDAQTPLKGVASISVPDAKTLQVEPWDANLVEAVVKALTAADLGMTPNVQGKLIRLAMPQMTEERRKELLKVVKEKTETARVGIRRVREGIRDQVIKMEKNKELTEDERFRAQEDLDKMTKDFVGQVDKLAGEKEKEIMTV